MNALARTRNSSSGFVRARPVAGLSERGFVLGPMLIHSLTVARGLNASQARDLADEVRDFLELDAIDGENYQTLRTRGVLRLGMRSPGRARPQREARVRDLCRSLGERAAQWYPDFRVRPSDPPESGQASPLARAAGASPASLSRPECIVVTGPLGSGKSRLVNRLLAQSERKALVFINELGDEPVDHLLMRAAPAGSDIQVMASGCMCCQLGADFLQMLQDALRQRARGALEFDRIIVETSGAADPLELVQTIASNLELRASLDMRGVCTTLDARAWRSDQVCLTNNEKLQLAASTWLVPTMGDLLDPEEYAGAVSRMRAAAPWAREVLGTEEDPAAQLSRVMCDDTAMAPHHLSVAALASVQGLRRHEDSVTAMTLRAGAFSKRALRVFLDVMFLAKGEDILRVKGEVELAEGVRILLQAVKGYVHEVSELPGDAARGTRLTVIARNVSARKLRLLWKMVQQEVAIVPIRSAIS